MALTNQTSSADQPVGEILSGDPVVQCAPQTSLKDAAALMRARQCSSIIVIESGQPLGIWTERDALKIPLGNPAWRDQIIADYMSAPVRTVDSTTPLSEVSYCFRAERIRHLLVMENNHPKGVVSLTDVVIHQGVEHYLHLRTVGSLVHRDMLRFAENTPLSHVLERMVETGQEAVLVELDDGGHGIFTERDMVRLIAEGAEHGPIGTVATRSLLTVDVDKNLYEAHRFMRRHRIRHCGVSEAGRVVGIIGFLDLLTGIELAYIKELRSALDERDTALTTSQQNLQLAEKVIEASSEGIIITDAHGTIQRVNPAFCKVTGYHKEEAIGNNPSMLQSGRHDADFYKRIWSTLQREGKWRGEIWNRRKNGEIYPELLTITAIKDDQGEVRHYAALFVDITELKENERQIRHLAYYDPLTNLPNRRLFYDRLDLAIAQAHRNQHQLAVLFLDLDRFKRINDILGHAMGDRFLEDVSRRIEDCLREGDTVARTGGDEFVVLLPDIDHFDDAVTVAENIINKFAEPVTLEERSFLVTTSIGIAFYPEDGDDRETLLKHADIAMYRAKQRGRNNFSLFKPSMNEQARRRVMLEHDLREAIANQEIYLHYQPLVDASSHELIGAEALARWKHPTLGAICPDEFIYLAEETGLMDDLGAFVLETVGEDARQFTRPLNLSVNLSAQQFSSQTFLAEIARLQEKITLVGHQLTLEITETALMQDIDQHSRVMRELREKGIQFAIDDFGTGYSSLAYLRRLPLDVLKIDRSFVSEVLRSEDASVIVSATIALAHNLRLKVVAEGVEYPEQAEFLSALACDRLQGYYFGRPVSAQAFTALLD